MLDTSYMDRLISETARAIRTRDPGAAGAPAQPRDCAGWWENLDRLWTDLARLEDLGPASCGLSDELMNWIYADLRRITIAGCPD